MISFYRNADDALLEEAQLPEVYTNETAFSQTLFVRVENEDQGACFGVGPYVRLTVLANIDFNVPEEVLICEGASTTISVIDSPTDYMYEWADADGTVISEDRSVTFSEEGTYTVFAISEAGCASVVKTVKVRFSIPPVLSESAIAINPLSNGLNQLVVLEEQLGTGNFEYSLDDAFGPFQDSPVFNNVLPGMRAVYAKDKNGCGTDVIEIGVIGVSQFLTPNADSRNDVLEVLGVTPENYQSATLRIFNRYGKLLRQIDGFSGTWDGTYRNQDLPSSDYWYILEVVDTNGKFQKRSGNFTLKR